MLYRNSIKKLPLRAKYTLVVWTDTLSRNVGKKLQLRAKNPLKMGLIFCPETSVRTYQ
jgi:hypothetical protein